jgi:hypothetical protein
MAIARRVPLQSVEGAFEEIEAYDDDDDELGLEFVWDNEFAADPVDLVSEELGNAGEKANLSDGIIISAMDALASNGFRGPESRRKRARRNRQVQVFFGVSVLLALILGLFGGYYFATRIDKPRMDSDSQMESGEFEAIQAYLNLGD